MKERCKNYRRRILDISQEVGALHIGGAFSSVEIVDCIYNELLRPKDTFIMSKGHAGILQYVVLEHMGVLSPEDLAGYCKSGGHLGVHPERTTAGIVASTGSLGHGLPMAVGMGIADRDSIVYVLISDGELQEGSTWEAMLLASSLKLCNLIVFVDNNDLQSLERTSDTHPTLYSIKDKAIEFGWDSECVDGHDSEALLSACRRRERPLMIVADTVKGKGVAFMEDAPLWHYRSPSRDEYLKAIKELG